MTVPQTCYVRLRAEKPAGGPCPFTKKIYSTCGRGCTSSCCLTVDTFFLSGNWQVVVCLVKGSVSSPGDPTFLLAQKSRGKRCARKPMVFWTFLFRSDERTAKTARRSRLALSVHPAPLPLLLCLFDLRSFAPAPRRVRLGDQPPLPAAAARQRGWVATDNSGPCRPGSFCG